MCADPGKGVCADPGKGVCADPVGRDATWGVGGPGPSVGAGERQLSLDRGGEKSGSKEDDPITASRNDHAQSKCQRAWPTIDVNTHVSNVFIVLLFQENKSFGASTICIHPLMYVKPCREQVLPHG